MFKLAALAGLLACAFAVPVAVGSQMRPPPSFVKDALCVHAGWHFTPTRPSPGAAPTYVLFRHGFWKTWDVPDVVAGGSGEAGWHYRGFYRGGMQWTFGTWLDAGGSGDPASASPEEEILRTYVHVVVKGEGWSAWPNTARACGLR